MDLIGAVLLITDKQICLYITLSASNQSSLEAVFSWTRAVNANRPQLYPSAIGMSNVISTNSALANCYIQDEDKYP